MLKTIFLFLWNLNPIHINEPDPITLYTRGGERERERKLMINMGYVAFGVSNLLHMFLATKIFLRGKAVGNIQI